MKKLHLHLSDDFQKKIFNRVRIIAPTPKTLKY